MPTDSLHTAKPSLAYAKLVATPTPLSWSQVYNAGNLFASISLAIAQEEEGISLQVIGKELVNNLEAEFFTLEEKSLETIKKAISDSIKNVPDSVTISLCLGCFKDTILYLFIIGEGRIIMKREEKIGILLQGKPTPKPHTIHTASGFLQNQDIVLLQTKQFSDSMSMETIASALELALPNDIAEALSPTLHETDDGGQAAIIIVYHGVAKKVLEPEEELINEEETMPRSIPSYTYETKSETAAPQKISFKLPSLPKVSSPTLPKFNLPQMKRIPHTKKLFISIIVIIVALLAVSIFLTKQQQEDKQRTALFHQVYDPAQKNYDEAKELKNLNPTLSQKELLEAEHILKDGQHKFSTGSHEEKQISDLLANVETELNGTQNEAVKDTVQVKEAAVDKNSYLSIEKANAGLSFAQDTGTVYVLNKNAIAAIKKVSADKKDQILNESFWSDGVALSPYQGNMYVLDAKKGILKFVSAAGKPASYFSGSAPDLSKATAIAIDGSIWILQSDGSILKYTKGSSDNLKLQGLTKPLNSPIKILTNLDSESVYVLDKGNSRIVVFDKKGNFQKDYTAKIIKDALDFDVLEKDKKFQVLSNNKIWEINF